ncbi:hypothetical protein MTO96_025216 [Rhipicephalus appendiculatus]
MTLRSLQRTQRFLTALRTVLIHPTRPQRHRRGVVSRQTNGRGFAPPSTDLSSALGQVASICPAVENDDQHQGVAAEDENRMSLELGCYEDSPDSQRPVVDDGMEYVLIASESGGADDDDVYVVCESRTLCAIQKL